MADFQTSAALSIDIPNRELRDARRQIESELGDVSVSVDAQGAGASMRGGGGGGGGPELRRLADERNTLLREIVDQFQAMGGGGGGARGGGGGPLRTTAGGAGGSLLGRLGAGAAGAGGVAAGGGLLATLLGLTLAGGAATGGIFAGLRQLTGPRQVDRNTAQVERAERASTGLPPAFTATSPTGIAGLGATIQNRITEALQPQVSGLVSTLVDRQRQAGSGGLPRPLRRDFQRDQATSRRFRTSRRSATQRLRRLQGAPTSGGGQQGRGVSQDFFADQAASQRLGAGGGPSSVEVTLDVSNVTGEPVEQAVTRAIERQRSRIEASIRRDVEERISRAAGGGIGGGGQ